MRRLHTLVAGIFAAFAVMSPAWAAPQWCTGTVADLYITSAGDVVFVGSWRGDYTRVCNLDQPQGGVSALTCASWMALLSKAVTRSSTVIVYYADAPACSALPSYGGAPIASYVMQVN